MRKPDFITFTGADDHTSVDGMVELARHYPIEWGILFHPPYQGSGRYPGEEAQRRLRQSGLRLSAHLCGDHSHRIMAPEPVEVPVVLEGFSRIQVNHAKPDPRRISEFGRVQQRRCIAQWRQQTFPQDGSIDWLFDCSGGRGREPSAWPRYPGRFVGYSGGIGPDNVARVIEEIDAAGPYWIDMESKVRVDDRFELDLCRQVCEVVYGRGRVSDRAMDGI
jgi:hypothetical protein